MKDLEKMRKKVESDHYEWVSKEPNSVRLMMAVQRSAVLLGRDHVKILSNYEQPEQDA